jgi:hypothetical protein
MKTGRTRSGGQMKSRIMRSSEEVVAGMAAPSIITTRIASVDSRK